MSFRQSVNTWGTIVFGTLIAFGAVKSAIEHFGGSASSDSTISTTQRTGTPGGGPLESRASSLQLTAEEQAEVDRIKGAGNLAGQMGHDISPNTKLFLVGDDFGENRRCAIHVGGQDPRGQLVNGRWNLVVQTGPNSIVWTTNMLGPNGSEVRLTLAPSGKRFVLDKQVSGDGRGVALDSDLLDALMVARSATASSGLLGNTELGNEYDLSSFQRAYKLSKAVCS